MDETQMDSSEEEQITIKNKKYIALCILIITSCILVAIISTIAITYKREGIYIISLFILFIKFNFIQLQSIFQRIM